MFIKNNIFRYQKYLDYYKSCYFKFGASNLLFLDDGSERKYLELLKIPIFLSEELPESLHDISIITFLTHLGRPTAYDLKGWWRSFLMSPYIAERYDFDKLVIIESDAYILSDRLVKYIKEISEGWVVLWCPRHRFPEPSIQVIIKDSFAEMKKVVSTCVKDKIAEHVLPFTLIEKGFKGDRYGEYQDFIPDDADFSCQSEFLNISKWEV